MTRVILRIAPIAAGPWMFHRLYIILIVLVGFVALYHLDQHFRSEQRLENDRILGDAAMAMQRDLNQTMLRLVDAVADFQAFMLAGSALPDDVAFERFGASLVQRHPALNPIVHVGPDRVIRRVYPILGNEGGKGLDLKRRASAPSVERAIAERRLLIDQPHRIHGGRLAIVARAPLYRGDELLGLAQGVFDIETIAQEYRRLWSGTYVFNLRDEQGEVFWGDQTIAGAIQTRRIAVGEGYWLLTVGWEDAPSEWSWVTFGVVWGGGGLFVFLLAYLIHRLGNEAWRLNRAVEEKTRALAESERRYRGLMENASDAILVADDTGRFIDANRRAEKVLGYDREELLRLGPLNIHPVDSHGDVHAAFREMNEQGSSLHEHKVLTRGGEIISVEVAGSRIDYGDRHVYLGAFRDITERKRHEDEMRRKSRELAEVWQQARIELEQRVNDRTRELKAAYDELEAFSYSVSHDLRGPLRAINGFSCALEEEYGERLDGPGRGYLERMRRATINMGELIDGLLNLARVFRSDLCVVEVDLSALAAESIRQMRDLEPAREVHVEIAPSLKAEGDPALLRVLLDNLLSNAWKFSAPSVRPRLSWVRPPIACSSCVITGSVSTHLMQASYFSLSSACIRSTKGPELASRRCGASCSATAVRCGPSAS